MFGAWALLVLWVDDGAVRRRTNRIACLLRWKKTRLKALGMELWKRAAAAMAEMECRKATLFARWKLFVLVGQVRYESAAFSLIRTPVVVNNTLKKFTE